MQKLQKKKTLAKKPKQQPRPNVSGSDTITITGGSGSDDILTFGSTITSDLSTYSSGIDSLTITNSANMSDTITFPSTYNLGSSSSVYTTSYDWNNNYQTNSVVDINTGGININDGGDIKIRGKSLSAAIEKIEERLGILNPNPELEERWEQLKELRQQYIEMEKDLLEKEKIMKILKET